MRKQLILLLSLGTVFQPTNIANAEPTRPYLSLALNPDRGGPIYQYDLEYSSLDEKVVARINPNQERGGRVKFLSQSHDELSDDFIEVFQDIERNPVEEFWCAHLSEIVPLDAAVIAETADQATYAFKPRTDLEDPDDTTLMKHLDGQVTVSKTDPQVLSMSLIAPRSFKPDWIAKITHFEMSIDCERVPDGRTHMKELRISIAGKAALKTFYQRERKTLSNVIAVADRIE